MSLAENVVLVRLKISDYRGMVTDFKTTEEIRASKNAAHGATRSLKYLLKDNDYFKRCASATRALRTYNEKVTIPWEDGGMRALPVEKYFEYGERMRALRAEFEAAKMDFVANLIGLREQDRARMGDLYDENDYPSPEQLESMYSVDLHMVPLQNLDDIRVRVPEEEKEKMRADCDALFQDKLNTVSKDLWQRLYKALKRMVDNLEGNSRIYDTMLGNITELTELLPALNIGNDPQLAYMTREIEERLVRRYTTDSIKDNTDIKEQAHDDAQEILDQIDDVISGWR